MAFKYGTTSPTAINYGGTSLTVLQYGINGYDVLDYIEATGTQWIQTNLLSSNFSSKIIKCEIGIMPTSGSSARAYSTWIGCQQNLQYLLRSDYGKLCTYAGGNINYPITMVDNTMYDMSFTADYNNNVINMVINGTNYNYTGTYWGSNATGITLFASHAGEAPWDTELGLGRLYYCRFYDNNNLIRDFIPARRKSDNVVGLYDKLNNVFYTNSGSGSFVAGNNIKGYPVWGKPYSLSISAGSNTSVTVTRTSSPNQHASTGTLSSGSVIYYGDTLTISYSVSSGYKINTATVNGTTFTSGQTFTATSAISVVTTAEVSASWHTVWTGKTIIKTGNNVSVAVTGLNPSAQKTRVTFNGAYYYEYEEYIDFTNGRTETKYTVNAKEIACGVAGKGDGTATFEYWEGQSSTYLPSGYKQYIYAKSVSGNNIVFARTNSTEDLSNYDVIYKYYSITGDLTKVEQYY